MNLYSGKVMDLFLNDFEQSLVCWIPVFQVEMLIGTIVMTVVRILALVLTKKVLCSRWNLVLFSGFLAFVNQEILTNTDENMIDTSQRQRILELQLGIWLN